MIIRYSVSYTGVKRFTRRPWINRYTVTSGRQKNSMITRNL